VVIAQCHIGGGAERKGSNTRYYEIFAEREREGRGCREACTGIREDLLLTKNETSGFSESQPTLESNILTERLHNP
jgi:hypothetical protein